MSIKSFFLKKMLKSKGVPDDQIDMVMTMMEKNPELFQKIAMEIDQKMKDGKDQTSAMMEIAKKYQNELKGLM